MKKTSPEKDRFIYSVIHQNNNTTEGGIRPTSGRSVWLNLDAHTAYTMSEDYKGTKSGLEYGDCFKVQMSNRRK